MKYFVYLFILAALIQCKNNTKKQPISSEEKVIKKELIGNPLSSISHEEDRLGIKFDFEPVDIINYDINDDDLNDIISIEKIKDWDDPGDFHRIVIRMSNKKEYLFFNIDGWVKVSDYELQFENNLKNENLSNSKYLLLLNASKKDILLVCFGYVYASQPGLLSVINLNNPSPQLNLNDNYFIHQFKDIDDDEIKDIVLSKYDKENLQNEDNLKTYRLFDGWYQSE